MMETIEHQFDNEISFCLCEEKQTRIRVIFVGNSLSIVVEDISFLSAP